MQKDIVNSLVVVSPKHQQTARIERQTPDERTASAHVRVASDVSAAWSRGAVDNIRQWNFEVLDIFCWCGSKTLVRV